MIQIIGSKKCRATKKAKRFFSERGIGFQDFDLKTHRLSPGELSNIAKSVPPEELIDSDGDFYRKAGYQWREYDPLEEILEHPELLKTPVVRAAGSAVCGDAPNVWSEFVRREKG
ncbi:arsenate reductase family protein [Sediminispirochaeta bajacaliforniensis]|uniref:arsenate reductase family protein n=1 Tax=Sediminispirochaeta bajacaliforniensis TaxID=148 RepID=UPI000374C90C|nr:ArsC/Spx/MgsR family protein [Sediminispirochaeta bajacaliforniensis]